mmetsp:Transcript_9483/g.9271  ORF Transcript_9483/g.9271 Transcript_9483/m.9271 type:complete len:509 (-) Transcript_9483:26-1552(-)
MTSYQPYNDTESYLLKRRELSPSLGGSIGYTRERIMSFGRVNSLKSHQGCVNSLKWSLDGSSLISGSDDRTVKIWNFKQSIGDILLKHTMPTSHRANIFCVNFSPISENIIVSCAADGTLFKNDLNSAHGEVKLMKSPGLMHMFLFDIDQPQVLYTAEDFGPGIISRVDLRTNISEKIFSTKAAPLSRQNCRNPQAAVHSMKALAQSSFLGGSQMVVGGKSFVLGLIDLRCLAPVTNIDVYEEGPASNKFVKAWSPHYGTDYDCDALKISSDHKKTDVSISGLDFSGDGRSLLASYQGDQIYVFDLYGKEAAAHQGGAHKGVLIDEAVGHIRHVDSSRSEKSGARSMFGGHINQATFLKSVSFFGPKDEYIVSGSDTGHLWIWDARSGSLDVEAPEDRSCRVLNFLKADNRTCNGAIPHPFLPILGSYGIDSDVKVWAFETRPEEGEELNLTDSSPDRFPLGGLHIKGPSQGRKERVRFSQPKYCDMNKLPDVLGAQMVFFFSDTFLL